MKKLAATLVLAASLFGWSGTAHAATLSELKRDCRKGNEAACEEYAYRVCVTRLKANGFSTTAAEDRCDEAVYG